MKVRDIERLLAGHGIGKTKMDIVTRRLREVGQLPTAARGANAPAVTTLIASKVLIATAGSGKGVSADRRLLLLKKLRSERSGVKLLHRLRILLKSTSEIEQVAEFRIGRNFTGACLVFLDGSKEHFLELDPRDYSQRLKIEGVIPGRLLMKLSLLIASQETVPVPPENDEPDAD